MLKIAIVEDHLLLAQGVKELVESSKEFRLSFVAQNQQELFDKIKNPTLKPDLILLDISLEKDSGISILSQLKKGFPTTKVVMLTMFQSVFLCKRCLNLGADGYLLKKIGRKEFIAALNKIVDGDTVIDSALEEAIRTQEDAQGLELLSSRELDIFLLVVKNFSTDEIAEKLHVTKFTVDFHRKNIKAKLDAKTSVSWAQLAHDNGLLNLHE